MRPATAYSKCYILYLFVTVILLSLTSLHMCVVVAAEEPLEENVVAELKQKAGEVEKLAGGVREANKEMVASAREVVSLLTTAAENIEEELQQNNEVANEENNKWAATLEATNTALESASKALKVTKKIRRAANEVKGATKKMAARAKVVLNVKENMRSFIGEFKNETDTIASLWGKVSSDDVQSLLETTNAVVAETSKAKKKAENVRDKTQLNLQEGKTREVQTGVEERTPNEKLVTSTQVQQHKPESSISQIPVEIKESVPNLDKQYFRDSKTDKVKRKKPVPTALKPQASPLKLPFLLPHSLREHAVKEMGDKEGERKEIKTTDHSATRSIQPITKILWLMRAEDRALGDSQHKKKNKKEVVDLLVGAAEKATQLKDAVQSVKDNIDNTRQLSERIAQLADTVIKMSESKELSVLPSSFGSLVFVVNNICLTTFVTFTYVFGNTL